MNVHQFTFVAEQVLVYHWFATGVIDHRLKPIAGSKFFECQSEHNIQPTCCQKQVSWAKRRRRRRNIFDLRFTKRTALFEFISGIASSKFVSLFSHVAPSAKPPSLRSVRLLFLIYFRLDQQRQILDTILPYGKNCTFIHWISSHRTSDAGAVTLYPFKTFHWRWILCPVPKQDKSMWVQAHSLLRC